MKHVSAILFAGVAIGCGGSGTAGSPADGGAGDGPSSIADGGSGPNEGGTGSDGSAAASCVPAIPQTAWTSPYAGWTRGIPTDPKFFPIAVWLQQSSHATELHQLGVNIYVGNNAGTDPLAASDLATLKGLGMYAIIGQDSTGLASIDDPTIVGWWMTPDEPDNAQSDGKGGYGPPVDPSTLVTQYDAYKQADPTRPMWLGLGQGVAYDAWEGRGSNPPPGIGLRPGERHRVLRHLPVQQLRWRHERAGDLRSVLAERVRRRPAAPVVEPQPGGVDGLRDDGHRRRNDRGPDAGADRLRGVARPHPRGQRGSLLHRLVEPVVPRGRDLRELGDGHGRHGAEPARSSRSRPS